ncbi:hypothetical protein M8675_07690, partial [Escherichia coli]|nr:hypothetical protein [Escherichia coli]
NRLIRCVCGKKIGPDPRNFNQRVSLGRNDLLIRTFPNQFITIPVEETLPVAQYAAVWSKNYRIKKAASVLVELAKEYSSYNGCRRRQLIEVG